LISQKSKTFAAAQTAQPMPLRADIPIPETIEAAAFISLISWKTELDSEAFPKTVQQQHSERARRIKFNPALQF
jgi:hypothetical protein